MKCSLCAERDTNGAVLYRVRNIKTRKESVMCDDCWEALETCDFKILKKIRSKKKKFRSGGE